MYLNHDKRMPQALHTLGRDGLNPVLSNDPLKAKIENRSQVQAQSRKARFGQLKSCDVIIKMHKRALSRTAQHKKADDRHQTHQLREMKNELAAINYYYELIDLSMLTMKFDTCFC